MKLNVNTFASDSFAQKIIKAMHDVLTSGRSQYVENRKGERVDIKDGFVFGGFQILTKWGQDVTQLVDHASRVFWDFQKFLGVCWAVSVARVLKGRKLDRDRAAKARNERVERAATRIRLHALAKQAGATHIIRTDAGRYYFASFKKSFFGLGKTVVTVYPAYSEKSYQLTPEY
jgi:hypothetical protein